MRLYSNLCSFVFWFLRKHTKKIFPSFLFTHSLAFWFLLPSIVHIASRVALSKNIQFYAALYEGFCWHLRWWDFVIGRRSSGCFEILEKSLHDFTIHEEIFVTFKQLRSFFGGLLCKFWYFELQWFEFLMTFKTNVEDECGFLKGMFEQMSENLCNLSFDLLL